jgi:hypothetical protein
MESKIRARADGGVAARGDQSNDGRAASGATESNKQRTILKKAKDRPRVRAACPEKQERWARLNAK